MFLFAFLGLINAPGRLEGIIFAHENRVSGFSSAAGAADRKKLPCYTIALPVRASRDIL